ncbi:phage holin family protein [Pseudomonas sp. JDS28PS106]|uniref:phage holin family protein n=1 Tax=Pseudomonas sp. JDS28PS106 TaxID=2497235 RepID=UPI002FD1C661
MNEFLQRPSVETFLSACAVYAYQFLAWLGNVMPEFMLGSRGVCHLLIFLFVVGYQAPTNSHRKIVGMVAGAFAGANAAEAYRIAYNFTTFSALSQPPLTLVMLCVLFFVIYARGNMGRILPKKAVELIR